MNYIFAPHLDDELIGCYSILSTIDKIIYWTKDYREEDIEDVIKQGKYIFQANFDFSIISSKDTIYIPSRFDFHPLHHKVRKYGMTFDCKRMYYSVEMNVPWLEEEDPKGKLQILRMM